MARQDHDRTEERRGDASPSDAVRLNQLDGALLALLAKRLARALLLDGAEAADLGTDCEDSAPTTSLQNAPSSARRQR
jgi:hypothetical protein